jgi:ATP-dependent DNA helicase RecG
VLTPNSPIITLGPVGKAVASRLKKIDLSTAEDLLWHFPFRYDDYSHLKKINALVDGETVTVKGRVELITNKRSKIKRMNITEAMVADETQSIKVVWFNQPFLTKNLHAGDEIYLSGTVSSDYYGSQFVSPDYEKITNKESLNTGRIAPIYSSTSNVSQKQIRFLVKNILSLANETTDWLPKNIQTKKNLISLAKALNQIHFPSNQSELDQAKKRLKFDEHFLIQLQSQSIKLELKQNLAPQIKFKEQEIKEFVKSLPFELTQDQKKSAWEILQDLEKNHPMNRLLEGDVGSGKTIVAIMAMLNTVLNNYQATIMAPTEILAKQHFATITKILKNHKIKIGIITRTTKQINFDLPAEQKKLDAKFISQNSDIIIGTHSIIQEKLNFQNLGLAIIDEQHRFGVAQRHTLNENDGQTKTMPHFLSMSATPIPRSLSLVIAGDLSQSIIKQMPANRKPITTKVVEPQNRKKAYEFIEQQVSEGRQVFVVCPLIDPSDKLGVKSAQEEYEKLNKKIFPKIQIGLLHGRLKKEEKEQVMKDFLEKKIKILVSTSIIEVGVDIPNATIMMIEGADRFGLAQLHQFRGRVGRGDFQSYCFLFSDSTSQKTKERLNSLMIYHNGFDLAEIDLQLRGPGEIYGTRQSGLPELKIASLDDWEIINETKAEAEEVIENLEQYSDLKIKLDEYINKVHLE